MKSNPRPAETRLNLPTVDVQQSTAQMFQGLQKLAQFNLQFMQSSLADAAQSMQALMAAKSPEEFTSVCTAQYKEASEKAADYGRQVQALLAVPGPR